MPCSRGNRDLVMTPIDRADNYEGAIRTLRWATFGQRLRAARLCWAPAFDGWMRCRKLSANRLLIEFHPRGLVPSHAANHEFVCWWDAPDFLDLLVAHLGWRPVKIKRPTAFDVTV